MAAGKGLGEEAPGKPSASHSWRGGLGARPGSCWVGPRWRTCAGVLEQAPCPCAQSGDKLAKATHEDGESVLWEATPGPTLPVGGGDHGTAVPWTSTPGPCGPT